MRLPNPKTTQNESAESQVQARATVAAVTDPKLAVTSVKLLSATCQ